MQIVIAALGRAVDMKITWHGKTDSNDRAEVVSLDGPSLPLSGQDEPEPFGFTMPCQER